MGNFNERQEIKQTESGFVSRKEFVRELKQLIKDANEILVETGFDVEEDYRPEKVVTPERTSVLVQQEEPTIEYKESDVHMDEQEIVEESHPYEHEIAQVKQEEQVHMEEMEEVVESVMPVIISVDCEENSKEDIAKDGPEFLGYDFIVDGNRIEEMEDYIVSLIREKNQPVIKVYVRYDEALKTQKVWTTKQIEECIDKGYI